MARTENQKIKLLALKEILLQKSDEEHPLSRKEITALLEERGIQAERKSIYNDVNLLSDIGLDVIKTGGRNCTYFIGEREFELAELKILVDVVQASNCLSEKRSNELIKKLENQASVYQAKKLQRNVVVANRAKTNNENVLYNVDLVHSAMNDNKKIVFKYYEWNLEKKLIARKNGQKYEVSPWRLVWDDENYYLVGYDHLAKAIRHYRVDKMKEIEIQEDNREGRDIMESFDLASFSKATFGMYAGEETIVSLYADNSMCGVIIDRFGTDITMRPINDKIFEARVKVNVSPQFYGWLCALGKKVDIHSPEKVKKEYIDYLKDIICQ